MECLAPRSATVSDRDVTAVKWLYNNCKAPQTDIQCGANYDGLEYAVRPGDQAAAYRLVGSILAPLFSIIFVWHILCEGLVITFAFLNAFN